MRRILSALVALAVLAATMWVGAFGAAPVPPLGGLLDPARGAWAAARGAEMPADGSAGIPALSDVVEVRYDNRGVPHIFARTLDDAMRALGYVVARDRLFQLDLQTHAASGRLTEWAGADALEADREMRRLGLPAAAERQLAALERDSAQSRLLKAYADGVNAWIDALSPADRPVEYAFLGTAPERWHPLNTMLLLKRMGWTLAYLDDERARVAVASLVGDSAARALLPLDTPIQEPIQPNWKGAPTFALRRLPPPGAPDTAAARMVWALPRLARDDHEGLFASNNWAVAPARTEAGHALLAGDPHLELTLPSIWYEAHLVVPGVLDAYGVTIPGVPGIVIGFTRNLAWSFTNTGADVLDLYRETFDDERPHRRYRLDGEWRALDRRVEEYRDPRGRVIATDSIFYTHRGPVREDRDGWLSMRWTVLDADNDASAFIRASQQETVQAFLDTMAAGFKSPAQNVIVADRRGNIAIRSTGHFPIRPGKGDGLAIRDGALSSNDWQGFWPLDRYPQAFNPRQGFLASANQQPIDPAQQFAYLGDDGSFEVWRALQINRLLRADSSVTPDDMRRFQTEPGSVRAELLAPYFLAAARAMAARGTGSARLDSAAAWLSTWDHRYTKDGDRAALFEAALRQLTARTWDELAPRGGRRVATPSGPVLLELLQDSASAWWDVRSTSDVVEDRDAVVAASLVAAWDSLSRRYGPPASGGWRLDRTMPARVMHLLGLPGFSITGIAVQGGPGTLNPSAGGVFGPSWRMVVELGDTVRAWGTYPGGQSGNPSSPRYADHLPAWRDGILDTLRVPRDAAGLTGSTLSARLTLRPAGPPR